MQVIRLLALISGLAVVAACARDASDSQSSVRPRENRLLGIDVGPGKHETPEAARKRGGKTVAQFAELVLVWDEIETAPGIFRPPPDAAARAMPPGAKVALRIDPLDGDALRTPADLRSLPFNNVTVINRFNRFLDHALDQVSDLDLVCLAIGREVNVHLGDKRSRWQEYQDFFEIAAVQARMRRPGLPVGVTVGFRAASQNSESLAALTASADVLMFTYYPNSVDGSPDGAPDVFRDFTALATFDETKPVLITEAGPPTGHDMPGQEGFVRDVFQAWDVYAESIALVHFRGLAESGLKTLDHEAGVRGW